MSSPTALESRPATLSLRALAGVATNARGMGHLSGLWGSSGAFNGYKME